MYNKIKILIMFVCGFVLTTVVLAGPPPHHHSHNRHRGNDGLNLAAGIVNLVAYGLHTIFRPIQTNTVIVADPQPVVVKQPTTIIETKPATPIVVEQPTVTIQPQQIIYYNNYPTHRRYYYNYSQLYVYPQYQYHYRNHHKKPHHRK